VKHHCAYATEGHCQACEAIAEERRDAWRYEDDFTAKDGADADYWHPRGPYYPSKDD